MAAGLSSILTGYARLLRRAKSSQDRIHYERSLLRLSTEIEAALLSQKVFEKQLAESNALYLILIRVALVVWSKAESY